MSLSAMQFKMADVPGSRPYSVAMALLVATSFGNRFLPNEMFDAIMEVLGGSVHKNQKETPTTVCLAMTHENVRNNQDVHKTSKLCLPHNNVQQTHS